MCILRLYREFSKNPVDCLQTVSITLISQTQGLGNITQWRHSHTKWNKISDGVLMVQYNAPSTLKQTTRNKLEKFENLNLGICGEKLKGNNSRLYLQVMKYLATGGR